MATVSQMQRENDNRGLVRKIQRAVAFLGKDDAELPDDLYEDGQLINIAEDGLWLPVGIVGSDGYNFGREPETEEVDALGYSSAVRSDVTTVARTVSFNPLEFGRKHMFELTYGTDLSDVTQDPETGSVVFDEPDMPIDAEYKLLIIGEDGPVDNNWVLGKGYFSVKIQGTAEEVWGSEGTVSREITLDVFSGEESGVPIRHYFGGTGAVRHKDVLGFDPGQGGDSGE